MLEHDSNDMILELGRLAWNMNWLGGLELWFGIGKFMGSNLGGAHLILFLLTIGMAWI